MATRKLAWHLRNVRTIFLSSSIMTSSAAPAQEFAASNWDWDLTPVFKLERKHWAGRSNPRYLAMMHGGAADRHLIIKIYFGWGSWPVVAAAAWSMGWLITVWTVSCKIGASMGQPRDTRSANTNSHLSAINISIRRYQDQARHIVLCCGGEILSKSMISSPNWFISGLWIIISQYWVWKIPFDDNDKEINGPLRRG